MNSDASLEFGIINGAAVRLSDRFGEAPPVAVVLGSGLGLLGEAMIERASLPYREIPGWISPSVKGHAGELMVGRIGDTRCAMLSGRAHLYEGYSATQVVRHVRTLRLWGVRVLVLTAAAGGIFRDTQVGELMVITDHINLTGQNPLVGKHDPRLSVKRFPDSTKAWDLGMTMVLRHSCSRVGIKVREGVYAGLVGPTYETPAEVDMLDTMGANSVGMSVVLENIAFRAMPDSGGKLGVVCGVAMLSNPAAGRGDGGELLHEDVMAACGKAGADLTRVLVEAIPRMVNYLI